MNGSSALLSSHACAVLASAYQLGQSQVEEDAVIIEGWEGADDHLILVLDQRHAWTPESEYSRHYLAAVREALISPD